MSNIQENIDINYGVFKVRCENAQYNILYCAFDILNIKYKIYNLQNFSYQIRSHFFYIIVLIFLLFSTFFHAITKVQIFTVISHVFISNLKVLRKDISMKSIFTIWRTATGPLIIPMTNDYLFRALLQRNNFVLRGLIASLLHLKDSDIKSVVIANPIHLGESITDKTFILDINVILNNDTIINLELQVINEGNWKERSLSYLCRSFDQLKSGESYLAVKPAIQIGLLNFTLFEDAPEFYATYQMRNNRTNQLYSDKLKISVLDLSRVDLATEADKKYHLDDWAKLFNATTWEDLKMLAQNNEHIAEAASTIYELSEEEQIRLQCLAREDFLRTQKDRQIIQARKDAELAQKDAQIIDLEHQVASLTAELERLRTKQ